MEEKKYEFPVYVYLHRDCNQRLLIKTPTMDRSYLQSVT